MNLIALNIGVMSVSIGRKTFFTDTVFDVTGVILAITESVLDKTEAVRVNIVRISAKLFWCGSARVRN